MIYKLYLNKGETNRKEKRKNPEGKTTVLSKRTKDKNYTRFSSETTHKEENGVMV